MKQFNNRRAFTLIELLVGIAIIGILAATSLAMLNPLEQIKKTRDSQRKYDFDQLRKSLEIYFIDNGSLYPYAVNDKISVNGTDAINWGDSWLPYMAKLPKDPSATPYKYETNNDDRTWYRLFAHLERCPDAQADCANYNYSVTSPNIAIVLPTPLPTPTSTPTPVPASPSYKRVFVTSTGYNANFGGLNPADSICNSKAASLGGNWKAWLSITGVNAKDRIVGSKYVRLDGNVIANSLAELANGLPTSLVNPINIDENVQDVGNQSVWTGTGSDGGANLNNCNDWTSDDSSFNGLRGLSNRTTGQWTGYGSVACNSGAVVSMRLYCFEQ